MNKTGNNVAEFMEGRVSTKGNSQQCAGIQTQSSKNTMSRLLTVREVARATLLRQIPEVGAGCVSSVCPDLCGGVPSDRHSYRDLIG